MMDIDTRTLTNAEKDALSAEYQRILEFCADESAEYSYGHYKKMCKIMDAKPTPSMSIQRIRIRRLAALIVAAVMFLLAGCAAFVYSEQIGDFFVEVYEIFIKGSFAEEDDVNNQFINEYYTLTYVPEGYEIVDENLGVLVARIIWCDTDGDKLIFEQVPISSTNYFFDNENGVTDIIEWEEYTIYYRSIDGTYRCIWNNDEYAFMIYFEDEISREEITEIISKIAPLEK